MKQITWSNIDAADRDALLQRPAMHDNAAIHAQAFEIVQDVREHGDNALRNLCRKFDRVDLDEFQVDDDEAAAAERRLTREQIDAIDVAIANVTRFHLAQRPQNIDVMISDGVRCERLSQAIDSVGLYVPAGSAPLPSTAIMLAVPAVIAGCAETVMCTPCQADGNADAGVVVAARRAGVHKVLKIGGAQAIAALAYGTETVNKVEKIFGPGNAWVTAAKTIVAGDAAGAAIDLPAGPSEVLIIADQTANAEFVAADLLSQAEHGEDSQVILLTTDDVLRQMVAAAIRSQLAMLPRRNIALAALKSARLILVESECDAIEISNSYAPEHLIIQTANPRKTLARIRNAGSVFLGQWSPESAGDYCSGTNHVLPTYGAARRFSGLGVDQFMRHMTVQEITETGLRGLSKTIIELASMERLEAHANAVRIRLAAKEVT